MMGAVTGLGQDDQARIDLDEVQRLTDAATPGPWEWATWSEDGPLEAPAVIEGEGKWATPKNVVWASGMHTEGYIYVEDADKAFIAAARSLVPRLAAKLAAAEAQLAEAKAAALREAAEEWQRQYGWHSDDVTDWLRARAASLGDLPEGAKPCTHPNGFDHLGCLNCGAKP